MNGDVSLNAGLRVASDSSFNANLYVGGSIVNTGLTNALALKAPLESPSLTGTPVAPTATVGTNTTQIATTAYVRSEISALVASAPATLDTLNELALALGNDAAFSTTVTNSLGLKAPLASPSFTGTIVSSGDMSLNAGLRVVSDSSFNGNLFIKSNFYKGKIHGLQEYYYDNGKLSKEGINTIGPAIELMAEAEGLQAHKNAVTLRLKSNL